MKSYFNLVLNIFLWNVNFVRYDSDKIFQFPFNIWDAKLSDLCKFVPGQNAA